MDTGLKIGDYVTLRTAKFEAYLGAEGILFDGLVVHSRVTELDDCLFCVHLQRQYSAAQEMEAFEERNSEILQLDEDDQDENVKKYMSALQRGNRNEITLNDAYLKSKTGNPVHFGDVIQLYHVKSRKYLVVNPKQLATSERENSRLSLSVRGNSLGWLSFLPRSKIDREGDRIIAGADCYLTFAERNNEFVHASEASPKDGFDREVNCSLEKTSWRVSIYQHCVDAANQNILLSSQLVYINDPETQSNLTVGTKSIESFDVEQAESAPASADDAADDPAVAAAAAAVGASDGHEYFHDFGDLVSKPIAEGKEDASAIWLIESRGLVVGGPFQWKTEQVRFRHLVSGRYLALITKQINLSSEAKSGDATGGDADAVGAAAPTAPSEEDAVTEYYFTTVEASGLSSPGTCFDVREQTGSNNFLTKSKALTISSDQVFMERGDELENDQFSIKPVKNSTDALNLLINAYVPLSEVGLPVGTPKTLDPLDVYSGLAARRHFSRFFEMTAVPRNSNVSTIWPGAARDDVAFFNSICKQIMIFSQGFDITATNVTIGVDKSDPIVRVRRQCLLRDLGVIETVLRMIDKLIFVTEKTVSGKMTDAEVAMTEMGSAVLDQCFKIIFYCVMDNPEIQIYVATFLKVLLLHLSTQSYAGRCVTEMLSKNMELQETKIGEPEISIFVDNLKTSTMNSMYLNLLQCCCSCEGQGVDGNQCTVASTLFDKAEDVLLFLVVDKKERSMVNWDEEGNSVFLKDYPQNEALICGQDLLQHGLPTLYVTWKNPNEDWSPEGLYGKKNVPITEMFAPSSGFAGNKSNAANPKITARKKAVAAYFESEMFLGAEMCMDRNYVAMHKLDPYFTFDSLITIMKLEDVSDGVKTSAARLLLCLHVDRDPQAETKIPCLTRTWSSIENRPVPLLPFVDASRQNAYVLIQQLVSEHLAAMAGRKWNSYSKYMLQMLLSLIKFNFYGSLERMKHTIKPVIEAVDRRNVLGSDASSGTFSLRRLQDLSTVDSEQPVAPPAEVKEKLVESEIPWQQIVLDFFESIPVMVFILCLVIIAVSVTIYEAVDATTEDNGSPIYVWGLCVLSVFIVDYTSRFYCTVWLRGSSMIIPFSTDFFNLIDLTVILIDVIFLSLPSGGSSGNDNLTKTLRLVRLARLLRIARAVKVINSIADAASSRKKKKAWIMPVRYLKTPADEIDTIRQSLDVLLFIQGVIDDRNLSLLLRHFYKWVDGSAKKSPEELLDLVVEESEELTLGVAGFDHIFMDTVMYVDIALVQSALDVIIAHNSLRQRLLENAKNVQILVTPKREQQFKQIESMLQALERNAETHELWGELESNEHHEQNKETKELLVQLTKLCRNRCFVLEFDEDFMPDKEIQNLYRNLGCFSICFKMLGLLESVEEDENGELSEVAANTQELCRMTNELLYWFFVGNPLNQQLGYSELGFFLETLDANIKSHHVVRAIFKNNESLMEIVPRSLLTDMGEKMEDEKSHVYLALASSITNVGDKNITTNQFEIVKTLTAPERFSKIAWGMVAPSHPEYSEKRSLMEEAKDFWDPSNDDLPPLLAYHLALISALSNCTVGRKNITSVEAKIQSIFGVVDVVASILDPDTILVAKLRLAQFLLNAIVDVEMVIPGLCQSASMWRLFESFVGVLEYAKDDFRLVEKLGWESPQISRHKIEYIITCVLICKSFFEKNYESSKVKSDDGVSGADTVIWPMAQINGIVVSLFRLVKEVYDLDSPRISNDVKASIYDAMIALNVSALQPVIAGEIEATHLNSGDGENEEDLDTDTLREREILGKYSEFLTELANSEDVKTKVRTENSHFIEVLEALPSFNDASITSDLRNEAFIQKLIRHVYDNITMVNGEKKLSARCTESTIWVIKVFLTMIENKMGMTIAERDDEGGDAEDERAAETVTLLNDNDVPGLCIDLIATGIDENLQTVAMKLLVGMLFKEGGATVVQGGINKYMKKTDSAMFFKQCCLTIKKLQEFQEWHGVVALEEGQEPGDFVPEYIIIIRFLQLLCEGHFAPNQDIMRDQPFNKVSHCILDELVNYLNCLSRIPCRTSTNCAIRVASTILEVIQGPCSGNQAHFALNTELLEVMNRLMHATILNDCEEEEEIELKGIIVDIYSGLLEGQGTHSLIVERLLSVVHIDVIFMLAKPWQPPPIEEGVGAEAPPSDDLYNLKVECGVLLKTLCDFKPSLREELKIDDEEDGIKDDGATASIEISWEIIPGKPELNRRFFHIPDVFSFLAKSSKDALVANVDRSNPENKLIDFMKRAKRLYEEVKHQEKLVEFGVSHIFSRENQTRVATASFILCVVINLLFLVFYGVDTNTLEMEMPDNIANVIYGLNWLQIVTAACSVTINFVVNSPVLVKTLRDENFDNWQVIFYTATDGMTMYYLWFLLFSVMGNAYDPMYITFLPFLYLIFNNPTIADILNAVIQPIKQLVVALILGIFIIYIFTFFIVSFVRKCPASSLQNTQLTPKPFLPPPRLFRLIHPHSPSHLSSSLTRLMRFKTKTTLAAMLISASRYGAASSSSSFTAFAKEEVLVML